METNGTRNPKHNSIPLTEGPNRAAARSYFRGIGFSKEDLHKPIIGVANTWTEIGPCNFHLRDVAAAVKEGIRAAGGTPMEFNTITIHDGITMGTQGMKASLISREVIADSVELVARGNLFDGLVAIAGCDKNMPGTVMALCRLDIPIAHALRRLHRARPRERPMGTIDITIQNVFEAIGAHAAGKIDDAGLEVVEAAACPGAGACGGQFTANTMAMACEFLGISPIYLSGVPATSPDKHAAREAGESSWRPRATICRPSQDHHPRRHRKRHRQRRCFRWIDKRRASLPRHRARDGHRAVDGRLRPHQRAHAAASAISSPAASTLRSTIRNAGGSRLLAKRLIDAGLIDGSAPNISGRTLARRGRARR